MDEIHNPLESTSDPKRKRGRHLKRFIIFAFLIVCLYASLFMVAIHVVGMINHAEEADVIVVLGAGLRRDGRAGWALTRRAEMGAELWHDGYAEYVLCTGAQADGYPRSEAAACKEILMRDGVPETAILLEQQSRSTEENAMFGQEILVEHGWDTVLLVTDSYHMLRAEWIFRSQGITAYTSPIPASRINYPFSYPVSMVREIVAMHWITFKNLLGIDITYVYGL